LAVVQKALEEIKPGWSSAGRRRLMGPTPLVSIVIPTKDALDVLRPCIESIEQKTSYGAYEIIIVDNGSKEELTLSYLNELEAEGRARVVVVAAPFNYSRLNNVAVQSANGDILAFLNNDIEVVDPGWLGAMVELASLSAIGAVGARLLYPNGEIQHAGVALGLFGLAGHPWKMTEPCALEAELFLTRQRSVSAVTGACMVVRRDVFESVGGFDEALAVSYNDVDLCLKIKKLGLRIVWTPQATLVHHESVSRGRPKTAAQLAQFDAEKRIMKNRWAGRLQDDPCYNPNLTPDTEDGGLALFPRHLHRG
jgi:GT2 family glycosyltransferase